MVRITRAAISTFNVIPLLAIIGVLSTLPQSSVAFPNISFLREMSLRKVKTSSGTIAPITTPSITTATQCDAAADYKRSSVVLHSTSFATSTGIFASMNFVGFLISIMTQSHVHLDLIGTGAFAVVALAPLLLGISNAPFNGRIVLSSACLGLWGTKLASFLFYRALLLRHDARLTNTLSTVSGTATFWIISFLWGLICSLPHTLGVAVPTPGQYSYTLVGTLLFLAGFTIETLADAQKWIFKSTNPGQYCNVGLWSMSQHPNFFGNLLLWSGILVMNVPALRTRKYLLLLSFLSPLFMGMLFYGQASGAMLDTVKMANARYGNQVGYADYIASTPLIIPSIWRGFH